METFDAIRQRRAVKIYDPTHRFTKAEEDLLIDLLRQTPSSYNIQHWRLVKVSDPELRAKIREAAWGQAQVTDASLLFVVTADTKAWEKNPVRYWKDTPQKVQDYILPMIKGFYEGREQVQRDEALRSVGFVMQTMMLATKAMGYDSSPMIGFDADKVAELINMPKDHAMGALLAIGKGLTPANPKPGYLEIEDFLIENHF